MKYSSAQEFNAALPILPPIGPSTFSGTTRNGCPKQRWGAPEAASQSRPLEAQSHETSA